MKTVKHHLAHNLPLNIFSLAVANSTENKLNELSHEDNALHIAFDWSKSPENKEYWVAVYKKYFLKDNGTIIPEPEGKIIETARFDLFKSILKDLLMKDEKFSSEEAEQAMLEYPERVHFIYEAFNKYATESAKLL